MDVLTRDGCLVMLSEMYTDEGDEFQCYLRMPGTEGADERGSSDRVCELWMQRLCQ